jgi:acetyl/propionyl-CoA carboxylase alpha subunit
MERAIRRGRHIEVQVVADGGAPYGRWVSGLQRATAQQKVIEESASTVLDARRSGRCGPMPSSSSGQYYLNAGTV